MSEIFICKCKKGIPCRINMHCHRSSYGDFFFSKPKFGFQHYSHPLSNHHFLKAVMWWSGKNEIEVGGSLFAEVTRETVSQFPAQGLFTGQVLGSCAALQWEVDARTTKQFPQRTFVSLNNTLLSKSLQEAPAGEASNLYPPRYIVCHALTVCNRGKSSAIQDHLKKVLKMTRVNTA